MMGLGCSGVSQGTGRGLGRERVAAQGGWRDAGSRATEDGARLGQHAGAAAVAARGDDVRDAREGLARVVVGRHDAAAQVDSRPVCTSPAARLRRVPALASAIYSPRRVGGAVVEELTDAHARGEVSDAADVVRAVVCEQVSSRSQPSGAPRRARGASGSSVASSLAPSAAGRAA
jgi:hypothetical protein